MSGTDARESYESFAEFYDVYVGERLDDLPFYLECARSARGAVLEIGAGSGRLTVPLARAGLPLVAVDISPGMLAADAVRRRVEIVEADVCRLDLGRRFELAMVPFYTFNYLVTPRAQALALDRIAAHLTGSGRLLVDVFLPLTLLDRPPTEPILKIDRVDPTTGQRIRGWNAYRFDREQQVEHRGHAFEVTRPDGTVRRAEFATSRRYWFRDELSRLFEQHGFAVERVCAGYAGELANDRSEQLLYVLAANATPSG
jgi:SAM-dependent methyltransferase